MTLKLSTFASGLRTLQTHVMSAPTPNQRTHTSLDHPVSRSGLTSVRWARVGVLSRCAWRWSSFRHPLKSLQTGRGTTYTASPRCSASSSSPSLPPLCCPSRKHASSLGEIADLSSAPEMATQRVLAQSWPRGPQNELHRAANDGSVERVVALLASRPSLDINKGAEYGWTPLMLAAWRGSSRVVRILLNRGANVSVVADDGHTPLHFSTQDGGHPVVTKMLLKAGADIEAVTSEGETPLHLAADSGCWEVAQVLIEAGASVNSVRSDGETPLFSAARQGHKKTTRVLLCAKANPLLMKPTPSGVTFVPLDTAAEYGQTEVVRELIQQVGIKGCGGASGGVDAFRLAALSQNVDVMAALAEVGVMDTGEALITAAGRNDEAGVKLLLQQRHGTSAGRELYMYVNDTRDPVGRTPLLCSIDGGMAGFRCSPRVVRLLVDAGADTVSAVPLKGTGGQFELRVTPIEFATCSLHENMDGGKTAMEKQMDKLRAVDRLFLQVEAVHAVSWLWPTDTLGVAHGAEHLDRNKTASTALTTMIPILRRRDRKRGALVAALSGRPKKPP